MNFFLMFEDYNCLKEEDPEMKPNQRAKQALEKHRSEYNFGKKNQQSSADKMTFEDEPHVVANFIKKIFRDMEDPLCQFSLIQEFTNIGKRPQDKKPQLLKHTIG